MRCNTLTNHHRRCLGQKLSKNCLEDHCSRDPVQVQSKGIGREGRGPKSRATENAIGSKLRNRNTSPEPSTKASFDVTDATVMCWDTKSHKNSEIHIDVSHSRQPLVKGERLVRYEVNTVMQGGCLPHGRKVAPNRKGYRMDCSWP